MQGTGDNNYSPKSTYTREQAVVAFNNIYLEVVSIPEDEPTDPTQAPITCTTPKNGSDVFTVKINVNGVTLSICTRVPV
jgi:hypothetical protein